MTSETISAFVASRFDAAFYRAMNPDVAAAGVDPLAHYLAHGWREGRAPMPLFDPAHYLAANPDVARAGVEPLGHFLAHGWREGRAPHALFDPDYYLERNPDLRAAGVDPTAHFARHGWREGRDVHPLFDRSFYLQTNPDVARAGVDPLQHFLRHGWREGRDPDPAFDLDFYAFAHPDVAAAGWNPLLHYVRHGQAEGRAFAPGQLGDDGRVLGWTGDDVLAGDAGANRVEGGPGNDTLTGGGGPDLLIGGPGADRFVVAPPPAGTGIRSDRDAILDFSISQGDKIVFREADVARITLRHDIFQDFLQGRTGERIPLDFGAEVLTFETADGREARVEMPFAIGGLSTRYDDAFRGRGAEGRADFLRTVGVLVEEDIDPVVRFVETPFGFNIGETGVFDVDLTADGSLALWSFGLNLSAPASDWVEGERGYAFLRAAGADLADLDPQDRQILVSRDADGRPLGGVRQAALSDDGATVAFVRSAGGAHALFVEGPDAMGFRSVREVDLSRFSGSTPLVQDLEMSGDGRFLLLRTTNPLEGAELASGRFTGYLYRYDIAADRFEAVSEVDGAHSGIMRYSESHWRPFTHTELFDADISADGRYVVYATDRSDRFDHLPEGADFVDRRGEQLLYRNPDTDETFIVVLGADVWLKDMETGAQTNLSDGFNSTEAQAPHDFWMDAGQPTISADGRVVAFTSNGYAGADWRGNSDAVNDVFAVEIEDMAITALHHVSAPASGPLPIHNDAPSPIRSLTPGESFSPVVSPDGGSVAFVTMGGRSLTGVGEDGVPRLLVRDLATGAFREAPDFFHPVIRPERPDDPPDGGFGIDLALRDARIDLSEGGERVAYRRFNDSDIVNERIDLPVVAAPVEPELLI